ncbi:B2 bradykinin receptor [Electrophorus electricus]|uniref:B2 bradykinin receptor n=1 Tax=Electrophorus electricus TaxID=8005 RepID=UPI0015D0A264|nr:B2 bradykinin receptor [Electrophorus electricus]
MELNSSAVLVPVVESELIMDNCNYTEGWAWLVSLQPGCLVLISIIGVLGNGLVLCVFCLQKKPCTVADIYLGNLAMADLVMVLCLPFWAVTIAQDYQWNFGQVLCKVVNMAIYMNYFCSILFLVLVSMDRYLALVRPLSASRLRQPAWAKQVCLGIWAVGVLLSIPSLLFRVVNYIPELDMEACYLVYPHPSWRIQRNLTTNVLGFVIPLSIIALCTHQMVRVLRDSCVGSMQGVGVERRSAHLVLTVLAVFLICWTPFQVVRILDTLDYFQIIPGCLFVHILDISEQVSTYLAYANSSINPFLYVVVGKHFRKRAKGVFKTLLHPGWKDSATNTTFASKCSDSQKDSGVLKKRGVW